MLFLSMNHEQLVAQAPGKKEFEGQTGSSSQLNESSEELTP